MTNDAPEVEVTPCVQFSVRAPTDAVIGIMQWCIDQKPPILSLRGGSSGPCQGRPKWSYWVARFLPEDAAKVEAQLDIEIKRALRR